MFVYKPRGVLATTPPWCHMLHFGKLCIDSGWLVSEEVLAEILDRRIMSLMQGTNGDRQGSEGN